MRDSTKALVKSFVIGGSTELQAVAQNLGQDELLASFTEILSLYLNDPESARLRTLATMLVAGYEPNMAKFGEA